MDMDFLDSMLDYIQNRSPEVKKYLKVRKLHQEIYDSMSRYINDIEKSDQIIQKLIYHSQYSFLDLNLGDKRHQKLYAELVVYPQVPGVESLSEEYLRKRRFRKQEKIDLLNAMINSRWVLVEIKDRNEEDGLVLMRDIIRNSTFYINDKNLGKYGTGRNFYYYMHIIDYDDICFQTGFTLTYEKTSRFKKWIKRHKQDLLKKYSINQLLMMEDCFRQMGHRLLEEKYVAKK